MTGLNGSNPVGTRIIKIPHPQSYGMQHVMQEVFDETRRRYDSTGFWQQDLRRHSFGAVPANSPTAIPNFLWIGLTIRDTGVDSNLLADQFADLARDFRLKEDLLESLGLRSGWGVVGLTAQVLSALGIVVSGPIMAAPAFVVGTAAWAAGIRKRRRELEAGALSVFEAPSDRLTRAFKQIGAYSKAIPTVVAVQDAHLANPAVVRYLQLICSGQDNKAIVLATGEAEQGASWPSDRITYEHLDSLNPALVQVEQAEHVTDREIHKWLGGLLPTLGTDEIAERAALIRGRVSILADIEARRNSIDHAEMALRRSLDPLPNDAETNQLLGIMAGLGGVIPLSSLRKFKGSERAIEAIVSSGLATDQHGLLRLYPDGLAVAAERELSIQTPSARIELEVQTLEPDVAAAWLTAIPANLITPETAAALADLSLQAEATGDLVTAAQLGILANDHSECGSEYSLRVARWITETNWTAETDATLANERKALGALSTLSTAASHLLPDATIDGHLDTVRSAISAISEDYPGRAMILRKNFATSLASHGRYDEAINISTSLDMRKLTVEFESLRDSSVSTIERTLDKANEYLDRLRKEEKDGTLFDRTYLAEALHQKAMLHYSLGRYDLAIDAQIERLPIAIDCLGRYHPDTLATVFNITDLFGRVGMVPQALKLGREVLPDLNRVLGPNHRDTLGMRGNVAMWSAETESTSAALKLVHELLPDLERVLGPNHRDTLTARNNIAGLTSRSGDPERAVELLTELLPDYEQLLGEADRETLVLRINIASITGKAGNTGLAAEQLTNLLPDVERIFGPEHPTTIDVRGWIDDWS